MCRFRGTPFVVRARGTTTAPRREEATMDEQRDNDVETQERDIRWIDLIPAALGIRVM